jgi:hypothetical protein
VGGNLVELNELEASKMKVRIVAGGISVAVMVRAMSVMRGRVIQLKKAAIIVVRMRICHALRDKRVTRWRMSLSVSA